jgi:predicted O-linked N-acetylglucosamine transferase (SPINDLY family)
VSTTDVDQLLKDAVEHHRTGRLAEADASLRQALQSDPQNYNANYLLGMLALQDRRPADAVPLLSKAVELRPGAAEYHANLGHALKSLGKLDDAARCYERAVQLRPQYALAHTNLGSIRRAQGRIDEALTHYRIALRIDPKLLGAWMNLGNALRDQGRPVEAIDAYRRAAALDSKLADPRCFAATLLGSIGKADDAEKLFREALELQPDHLPSLINFGMLLRQKNDFDGAISVLRRAGQADPNSSDAHEKLARVLWAACQTDEGLAEYREALRLSPTPRMRYLVATLIPPVYRSDEDLRAWRQRLLDEVEILHRDGVKVDITNQPPPTIVYLPYQGFDDREVAQRLAELCVVTGSADRVAGAPPAAAPRPFAGVFADSSPIGAPAAPAGPARIKVGFISSLFRNQTVGLWMRGMIAKLSRDRFDVTVVSTVPHDDEIGRFIRQHADRYVVLPPGLPAARGAVGRLGLDVVIYSDIGMDPFTAALAHSRLAAVQCVTWGHPITSGIPAIDYFLSSALAETEDAQRHYTEKLVRFENLPVYYYRPKQPDTILTRRDFELPGDSHVYGCLQAQYKLHPQFDEAIGGILRRDERALVLLSRGGTASGEHVVMQRLNAAFPDVIDRVRFVPTLERDRFRALTGLCDVLLAPFPFGAGDSSLEGFALGLPTVTLPTDQLKGRLTYAMYKLMNIHDCVAESIQQYVDIAVKLGTDEAFNASVREKIRAASGVLYENDAAVREVEKFLESVAKR